MGLPYDNWIGRQAMLYEWIGPRGGRYPNENHFRIKDGEDGLSAHWMEKTTIDNIFLLIAISFNKSSKYLDPTLFKLFKFKVDWTLSIEGVSDVLHNPIVNGNPAPIGSPNNPHHVLIIHNNDVEVLVKLSDYCRVYPEAKCDCNLKSLEPQWNELRLRLNNTPFHST